eukprot:3848125-Prymnesium_polylepis.1
MLALRRAAGGRACDRPVRDGVADGDATAAAVMIEVKRMQKMLLQLCVVICCGGPWLRRPVCARSCAIRAWA